MGGQVSLLCIRSDLQCRRHTSVTQTDHSQPLMWSVEPTDDIWATLLVDTSLEFSFSVKSFCCFWSFGGVPSSEDMPSLLHAPLLLTLAFLFRSQTSAWCPCFQQSRSSLRFSPWVRSGVGGSSLKPFSSSGSGAQHVRTVRRRCCSAQKRLHILWVLMWGTSELLTVWALGLFCLSFP